MSEFSSTREGFQRAMEWSLKGNPDEAQAYAESMMLPTFYHIMNGKRIDYDAYLKGIVEWRGKVSEYKPVVHEFLRDGDQLAARMVGTIKINGSDTEFESFMFGKVDKATGKMAWLVERSVWGPKGGDPVN
ncbi:hypothetical protein F5Y06DRAFT_267901 [Hypoxylon sp. FL0890]|nr:hypothetical protein F5Y06DRAFT_267901 [Hypoxylon sp. FL0890]